MQKRATRRLQQALLGWYRKEGRAFPWRRTLNPYRILVSEVMLQQTQTSRVLVKYPEFIRRFPDVKALARARRSSVIRAWRGMGYNNRAVRLHDLARTLAIGHGGVVPDDHDTLLSLPGIGRYTANAILSFAFHRRVPVVETNVRRVLSRILFRTRLNADVADPTLIWDAAAALLPVRRSSEWNQALMDLGATVCTARNPRCNHCPVSSVCASSGKISTSPVAAAKHEPSFNGIPNRIYRGRIVELLRDSRKRRGIPVSRLGPTLDKRYGSVHLPWLRSLLASLERDGLVSIENRNSAAGGRVRLA